MLGRYIFSVIWKPGNYFNEILKSLKKRSGKTFAWESIFAKKCCITLAYTYIETFKISQQSIDYKINTVIFFQR